jgi:hypothetical protein
MLSNAGFLPDSESTIGAGIGPTEDDVSLLWLKSSSETAASVKILEDNASIIGLGQIYYGPTVALNFNDPTVDPRTPDIIVAPNVGVTYSGSKAKLAEHGGFGHDDTNVMLLVSNPNFQPRTVLAEVGTAQVAPTILKALEIDPAQLDAVRIEGVGVLPTSISGRPRNTTASSRRTRLHGRPLFCCCLEEPQGRSGTLSTRRFQS